MAETFASKLFDAVKQKGSPVVVGLDPDLALMPPEVFLAADQAQDPRKRAASAVVTFLKDIIDATHDVVAAVKPQLAFFERLGPDGIHAYEQLIIHARKRGLLVIGDGKRNDVPDTSRQYALAHLGSVASDQDSRHGGQGQHSHQSGDWTDAEQLRQNFIREVDQAGPKVDALTVSGYLGRDGLQPFIDHLSHDQGLFVLVKTSNPSSGDLQDLYVTAKQTDRGQAESQRTVYEHVASWVNEWNDVLADDTGYGPVGAVVGATYPEQLKSLRRYMPKTIFLIPGFGAQGGKASDILAGFDENGLGAVVNSSRGILYAYRNNPDVSYAHAARTAALNMRDDIRKAGEFDWLK